MKFALRDPQAKQRLLFCLLAIIILSPMFYIANFNPLLFFQASNLEVFRNFLVQFFLPATSLEFLELLFKATLETLAMATAGVFLAGLLAVPLGLVMTSSLSISSIGPSRGFRLYQVIRYLARFFMVVLRGVPEIVWALLLVRLFGLGPIAGVLAIAITYGGMLAKVYSEIIESSPNTSSQALMLLGSGRIQTLLYAVLPLSAQELASYTIYRWECAVRASVVMGFVGAGGLGQLMDQSMKMLNGGEVSTILMVFLALVFFADAISWYVRKQLL
jgi:phosphonate transport system permease protein